jgi:hypothetical protein
MRLREHNGVYELTIDTPRTNSACWDRSWIAEITPEGKREWIKRWCNTATTKDGGEVTYGPFREDGKYLYGLVYDGHSSNYAYNKYEGLSGAFTICNGEIVDIDGDQLRAREKEYKMRAHQQQVDEANDFASKHKLPALRDNPQGFAAIARRQLMVRMPQLAEYPITSGTWWEQQVAMERIGAGTQLAGTIRRVVASRILERAEEQLTKEKQLAKLQSHALCKEFPRRVTSVTESKIRIATRYGEAFTDVLRRLGAKWNRDIGRWELSLDQEADLRRELKDDDK